MKQMKQVKQKRRGMVLISLAFLPWFSSGCATPQQRHQVHTAVSVDIAHKVHKGSKEHQEGHGRNKSPLIYAKFAKNFHSKNHVSKASRFMITTQGVKSTQAGVEIMEMGGNAIDAAAAISFAIAVERPQSTGIGGGGFMMLHLARSSEGGARGARGAQTLAVDFREKAPLYAYHRMYLDSKDNVIPRLSMDGPLSIAVPGMVAGVIEVQKKYGKLTLKQILKPAIRLAKKGFRVYPDLAQGLQIRKKVLSKYPSSQKIFFRKDGSPLREGDLLVQKDLARSLQQIALYGKKGFYQGEVAKKIIATIKKYKGLIRQKDLDSYQVKWRKPIWGTFRGLRIASMPPPSSGGTHVIQILNILEKDHLKREGPLSPQSIHLVASAMQRAFADRATYLGDSDFVQVPLRGLIAKKYAMKWRQSIQKDFATPSNKVKPGNPWPFTHPKESNETTHFTVMDKEGNTVSSTQTINHYFGSGLVAEGTGIVLNDEMDDFSTKPGAKNLFGAIGTNRQNEIQPQKRPLSSMSPTLLFQGEEPFLALGTPSGTRIITCVTQTILNYIVHGLSLFDSIAAIRFHHQWSPDKIYVDPPGFPQKVEKTLGKMGHSLETKDLGCRMNAIAREGEILHGVADPRGEGLALGH